MAKLAVHLHNGSIFIGDMVTIDANGNVILWQNGLIVERMYNHTVAQITPIE